LKATACDDLDPVEMLYLVEPNRFQNVFEAAGAGEQLENA
jgi:hypothetical protein